MRDMRRGLVVGKFMPFHRGHELLVDYALAECDDVTVIVYDDHPAGSFPPMPAGKRAGWVSALYPTLENIVVLPDPWESEADSQGPAYAERYAEQLTFLGRFDRFYSSEPSYDTFARLVGAEHRVLDEAREMVPVSGTAIRSNPYRYRGMMSPLVYSSLIQRVALVGTESSGKSTLARTLANELGTEWVHEFGRELWEAQGLTGSFSDLWRSGATSASGRTRLPGTPTASCSATRRRGRRCTGRCARTAAPTSGSTTSWTRRPATTCGSSARTTSAGSTTARGRWRAGRPIASSCSRRT